MSDLRPPFSVRWCHTDADPAADGAGAGKQDEETTKMIEDRRKKRAERRRQKRG